MIHRCRWIGNRSHVNQHGRSRGAAVAIADRVRDRINAGEVRIRRVVDRAVRIDNDRSIWSRRSSDRQRIAIRIRIITEDIDVRQRRVFRRGATVRVRNRRVLCVRHRDSHGRRIRSSAGIDNRVRKRVGAEKVWIGRVVDRAVRQHGDRTVAWRSC